MTKLGRLANADLDKHMSLIKCHGVGRGSMPHLGKGQKWLEGRDQARSFLHPQ